jgi:hypothetical protein
MTIVFAPSFSEDEIQIQGYSREYSRHKQRYNF